MRDQSMFDFASTMLSLQEPVEGQSGIRCDTLSFMNIPPDAFIVGGSGSIGNGTEFVIP